MGPGRASVQMLRRVLAKLKSSEDSNPHLTGLAGRGRRIRAAGAGGRRVRIGNGGDGPDSACRAADASWSSPMTSIELTGELAPQAITNDATPQFSGSNAEAGASVTLMDGAAVLGKTVVAANGSWSFTPSTPLAEGLHSISYTLSDAAGNKSLASTPVAFTVDTQAPGTLGVGLGPQRQR